MSEPDVNFYIDRIKVMLGEIDSLVLTGELTNSKREIISFDTNEIETDLHIILRKMQHRDDTTRNRNQGSS